MNTHIFEKQTIIKTTVDDLLAWHDLPTTMPKLAPPPIYIQIIRDDRKSLTEGELEFNLWFGPMPIRWIAKHEPGPIKTSFADLMTKGPLAYWRHEHLFEEIMNGVKMTDRITIAHHNGIKGFITRLMFDGIALRMLFSYRHLRTKLAFRAIS